MKALAYSCRRRIPRQVLSIIGLGFIVGLILLAVALNRASVGRKLQVILAQRRCAKYVAERDAIAYEEALIGERSVEPFLGTATELTTDRATGCSYRVRLTEPAEWKELKREWGIVDEPPSSTILVGAMSTLLTGKRIVVLTCGLPRDECSLLEIPTAHGPREMFERSISVRVRVFMPETAFSSMTVRTDSSQLYKIAVTSSPLKYLRIKEGKIVPTDPSRFSIRCETDQGAVEFRGRLMSDDTVHVEVSADNVATGN